MKKITMLLSLAVILLSACTKDKPVSNQTNKISVKFYQDSSVADQVILAPKNNQLLFAGKFNTGSINGFSLTSIKIKLVKGGDASSPTEYLRRIYFVSEGAFSGIYNSEIKDSVNNNEFTFGNFVKNFAQYQLGTVKVYADILSSATNNTGLEDNLNVEVVLTYTGYDGSTVQYFQTGSVNGHKIVFSNNSTPALFSISSLIDPSTPASGIILNGQEKSSLSYGVKFTGTSGILTQHKFLVQGQASGSVTVLKLFDISNNFIAQANVAGGIASIVTSDVISAGIEKKFIIKPVINVSNGDVSNYDFNIVLDEVKGFSSITGEQKTDGTDRIGNSFKVLKSIAVVTQLNVPTLTINNGTAMQLYGFSVTAVNGSISQKQFTYQIKLNDQGFNDTLYLKNFQILDEAGIDITNQYRFTKSSGSVDTLFSESDTKLIATRISGTGETLIPEGVTKKFFLRCLVGGFNHPNDGDGISVELLGDNVSSTGLKYVNNGSVSMGNSKLSTSVNSDPFATFFNYQWSDVSSFSHNGQFGQSSNDWIGGKEVFATLPKNNFYQ